MKVLPCKWVFVIKTDSDGVPIRFKARLVVGGHRQVEGIDFHHTYAPVSRMATIRTMFAVSANRGWKVHQLDVTTAFLHGKIDTDVYMMQPPGFVDGVNRVCKLQKTLYGLKQAPRAWYITLKNALATLGFVPVTADSSFWLRKQDDVCVYLTSVVDDMLVVSENEQLTLDIVEKILKIFPGRHCGIVEHFNGMKVTWFPESHSVVLTQPGHIEKVLKEFKEHIDPVPPMSLPVKGGLRLCKTGTSDEPNSELLDTTVFHFRSLLGAVLYPAVCTRPDIMFIAAQLSKYSNAPTVAHWHVLLRVLSYLRATLHWGISLGHMTAIDKCWVKNRPSEPAAVAYADANHGTGIDDKRSITGLIIHVYGGPVSWASRTQSVTSTSTTESEFRALSEVSREALWLAKIVRLFGIPSRPFLIRGDNMGAIHAISNHCYTRHTKHIEIHHDFMRDRVMEGHLDYQHIKGTDNPADVLTKALDKHKFQQCRSAIGMVCLDPVKHVVLKDGHSPKFSISQ